MFQLMGGGDTIWFLRQSKDKYMHYMKAQSGDLKSKPFVKQRFWNYRQTLFAFNGII